MAVALVRKQVDLDPTDIDAVRVWLMAEIRRQVALIGEPHPRLLFVGDGFLDEFDLDAMARQQPQAHAGATFQLLRRRPAVARAFALVQVSGEDDVTGEERRMACLFEERDLPDGRRRWWCAMLDFHTDEATGLGVPAEAWNLSADETSNSDLLYPFMCDLAFPPTLARPAEALAPRAPTPDIQVAFGELAAPDPTPSTARQMVSLAAALAVRNLLAGRVKGSVVIRLANRYWEQWVLDGDLPADLDTMIRYIANVREPAADGVALAQIAVQPYDNPPAPGVQVIGELGGEVVETWAPLVFPAGPAGPKEIPTVYWREASPVAAEGMWLGIRPEVEFEVSPLGFEA